MKWRKVCSFWEWASKGFWDAYDRWIDSGFLKGVLALVLVGLGRTGRGERAGREGRWR